MTPMERAERIVTVEVTQYGFGVSVDGNALAYIDSPVMARVRGAEVREVIARAIEEACAEAVTNAVRDHLASVVPEGPVSEERLQEIRSDSKSGTFKTFRFSIVEELLAAYDHLRSFCARLLNDDPIGQYQAGLEQGRREKAKVVDLLRSLEWAASNAYEEPCCPGCGAPQVHGCHRDGCALAALLREAG